MLIRFNSTLQQQVQFHMAREADSFKVIRDLVFTEVIGLGIAGIVIKYVTSGNSVPLSENVSLAAVLGPSLALFALLMPMFFFFRICMMFAELNRIADLIPFLRKNDVFQRNRWASAAIQSREIIFFVVKSAVFYSALLAACYVGFQTIEVAGFLSEQTDVIKFLVKVAPLSYFAWVSLTLLFFVFTLINLFPLKKLSGFINKDGIFRDIFYALIIITIVVLVAKSEQILRLTKFFFDC